ncbi:hypothetical protein BV20DRAFT_963202 [Pilatotrama ljubarskyi]|nr:hypothetical protein BV20DRAFT_963202 [Pilatotrama ljubarskyi]
MASATDITLATAYYELQPRIKEALPGCFLYPSANESACVMIFASVLHHLLSHPSQPRIPKTS